MRFRIFKEISKSTKKYNPANYEFYKDKNEYYYETRINILKKAIGWVMMKIVLFMMRDMNPDE